MSDPQPTLEQGLRERELLRPDRQRNYRIKQAANFTCQHPECRTDFAVVVVETKNGLETRCKPHIGRLKPVSGQWIERSAL